MEQQQLTLAAGFVRGTQTRPGGDQRVPVQLHLARSALALELHGRQRAGAAAHLTHRDVPGQPGSVRTGMVSNRSATLIEYGDPARDRHLRLRVARSAEDRGHWRNAGPPALAGRPPATNWRWRLLLHRRLLQPRAAPLQLGNLSPVAYEHQLMT
jgi:hypothetical protein